MHVDSAEVHFAQDQELGSIPMVIFVALQSGTKLRVYPDEDTTQVPVDLDIPAGSMFVTSQDFPHGGAAYQESNTRLLIKLTPNIRRGVMGATTQTEQRFFVDGIISKK